MDKVSQHYDIADLAEFMRKAKVSEKPFVFFTGAGCSFTAGIPLAKQLIEEMHRKQLFFPGSNPCRKKCLNLLLSLMTACRRLCNVN
ncbi:hypothetical protein [Cellvibrio fibrivorans]|uniref:Uncharacterized protein n=1 Tax=Cellvibrio fibrivorans TaxID=126350 RepID=A0ABU1V3E8_9GAMM|nr:hypothetical protein [Cellvibrio fibrivorans]MDR7091912.1 hypothetical protein [Cellvibrio fibrivorans]